MKIEAVLGLHEVYVSPTKSHFVYSTEKTKWGKLFGAVYCVVIPESGFVKDCRNASDALRWLKDTLVISKDEYIMVNLKLKRGSV